MIFMGFKSTMLLFAVLITVFLMSAINLVSADYLGNWKLNTNNYPISSSPSCVLNGAYIYCIGGVSNVVYAAPITNNVIGAWTSNTAYPGANDPDCVSTNNYIYCIGGGGGGTTSVYSAQISNNAIGAWVSNTAYPIPIHISSCNINNNYIYCIAGESGGSGTTAVYSASIVNNAIGAWVSNTAYPINWVVSESCNINNGYLYCIGGRDSTFGVTSVYSAPISNNAIGDRKSVV